MLLGNGYVNAPIVKVELASSRLRSALVCHCPRDELARERTQLLRQFRGRASRRGDTGREQSASFLRLWAQSPLTRAASIGHWASGISWQFLLSKREGEIICVSAQICWHYAHSRWITCILHNHTYIHTHREMFINLLDLTYHSNVKGKNSISSSSSQSIFTKNVARSLGMQRIRELEFSLNVILGFRSGTVFWPGGSRMKDQRKHEMLILKHIILFDKCLNLNANQD